MIGLLLIIGICHHSQAWAQVGQPYQLSGEMAVGRDVWSFQISANSSRVVYSADQDTDGVSELYSVPIVGGTPLKLNADLVANGNVSSDYQISANSSRVVYRADQDTDKVYELYSVPIDGGTPLKLNASLVEGGDISSDYQISADSSRVVYRADQDTNNVHELYSVPIDGGGG